MVKIKEYKVQKHGVRGVTLSLPKVWLDDIGLSFGDKIEIYRDLEDRLILIPKDQELKKNDQASELRERMGAR